MSSSDEKKRMEWLDYLREHKELAREKRFVSPPPPVWLKGQAVVFLGPSALKRRCSPESY